jgi:hypothetical protein
MKPMLKRIFPFILGGAVVVFAACQDNSQNLTEPAVPLEGRGGPTLQSQINQAIKLVWPNGHDDKTAGQQGKAALFAAGPGAGAQAAAMDLIALAVASGSPQPAVQAFIDLVSRFAMLPLSTFVEAAEGGDVTDDPDDDPGMGGVRFAPGQLPQNVAVTVELTSLPCHPLNQLPFQADHCVTITTNPALPEGFEFPDPGVLFAVCTDATAPNFSILGLFQSEGAASVDPVVKTPEETTPSFIVGAGTAAECQTGLVNTGSNWLGDFARVGWDMVGRPLASLLAPEPLHAATFLATSGSLGGRTKNFSNFGWAELGMLYGSDGYRYMEFGVGQDPPAGFETPGFDDSAWSIGDAPFWDNPGNASCAIVNPDPGGTTWTAAGAGVVPASQATETVLRRSFVLPDDATYVTVGIAIDNDVQVFVNGVELTDGVETHEGCATEDSSTFYVDDDDLNIPGVNSLVVRGIDRGVMSYVDAQVTFDTNGGEE